ncbi:hypothetical protein GCM10028775_46990 [Catellatospora paridis]
MDCEASNLARAQVAEATSADGLDVASSQRIAVAVSSQGRCVAGHHTLLVRGAAAARGRGLRRLPSCRGFHLTAGDPCDWLFA